MTPYIVFSFTFEREVDFDTRLIPGYWSKLTFLVGPVDKGLNDATWAITTNEFDTPARERHELTMALHCFLSFSLPFKNLYLEGNELSSLPDNLFSSLPYLLWLDLRNNQLTCLPADIGQHRYSKNSLYAPFRIPDLVLIGETLNVFILLPP